MMKRYLIPLAVIAVSAFAAVTLMATSPKIEPNIPEPIATTVRILVVQPEPVRLTVDTQGSVSPSTETSLIPEVSGRIVWTSEALVVGGSFKKGQPLVRLDEQDYRTAMGRQLATLKRAQAEFEHAKFEHARLKSLESRQLVSKSQLENALRAYRISEASKQDAAIALKQSKIDLSRTTLSAPFDGFVRSEQVDIGEFVSRGAAVAVLYASDVVEVRLPIADRQLAFLNLPIGHQGQLAEGARPKVSLSARYAGRDFIWEGEIVRTEAEIDSRSRSVNVVARIDNTAQTTPLAVGLFVEAKIQGLLAEEVVVLPRGAMRNNNQVLVVDDENRLRFRKVSLLRLYGDEVLVNEGLEVGERVCISQLQVVIEGMRVQTINEPS